MLRQMGRHLRAHWQVWGILAGLTPWAISFALAQGLTSPAAPDPITLPSSLWVALVAGGVQGLIWYGAVNNKLNSLTERMRTLETERRQDLKTYEERYQSLLKIFIDSMKGKHT